MSYTTTYITVRYAETDQMGIAHHANYAVWFEQARTEMIRKLGLSYGELERRGLFLPLTDLNCHYRVPAKYEDTLSINVSVSRLSAARVTFHYEVVKDDAVLSTGETAHAFVGRDLRPINLKKKFPEVYLVLSEFMNGKESE